MKQENTPTLSKAVTVTAVERPARKLILLRSARAHHFGDFCAEKGCDWLDTLDAIPEKLDTPALLCTWPSTLASPGTDGGTVAGGIEVPADYASPLPAGYETIDLPPCTMLYFQTDPFENEADWPLAMDTAWAAMEAYDLVANGWQPAPELAPRYNFGSFPKTGAKNAMPVRRVEK